MRNANLAAIALLLVITTPILLGFAMNFDEVESTAWESSQTVPLSEKILNHETNYYIDSVSPGNNSRLLRSVNSGGSWEEGIIAPAYVRTGLTYSSLPIYASAGASWNLNTYNTTDYSWTSGTWHGFSLRYDDARATPIAARDMIIISNTNSTLMQADLFGTSDYSTLTTSSIYAFRSGTNTWDVMIGSTTYANIDSWLIGTDRGGQYTVGGRSYTNLTAGGSGDFTAAIGNTIGGAKLTTSNGEQYVSWESGQVTNIVRGSGFVYLGNTLYTGVTAIGLVLPGSYTTLSYTYTAPSGSYADPAYGWKLPALGGSSPTTDDWFNAQLNSYVRMMVNLPLSSTTVLTPYHTNGVSTAYVELQNTSAGITVNGTLLGSYNYVMVEFEKDKMTVTGIDGWPSIGAMPVRYNSISVDDPKDSEITKINIARITGGNPDSILYRVDFARIVGGTFPSTMDYTLKPAELFPNQSYLIKINSVGVYGDDLRINRQILNVTDGQIEFTAQGENHSVPVRGLEIKCLNEGGSWKVYLNNIYLPTQYENVGPAEIYFGGEWSLTATYYAVQQVTVTNTEWVAGGFGFSEQGTLIVALLVDAAVFVGLGFYGRRSGVKVGWLLALCGCAGFVILCMM